MSVSWDCVWEVVVRNPGEEDQREKEQHIADHNLGQREGCRNR